MLKSDRENWIGGQEILSTKDDYSRNIGWPGLNMGGQKYLYGFPLTIKAVDIAGNSVSETTNIIMYNWENSIYILDNYGGSSLEESSIELSNKTKNTFTNLILHEYTIEFNHIYGSVLENETYFITIPSNSTIELIFPENIDISKVNNVQLESIKFTNNSLTTDVLPISTIEFEKIGKRQMRVNLNNTNEINLGKESTTGGYSSISDITGYVQWYLTIKIDNIFLGDDINSSTNWPYKFKFKIKFPYRYPGQSDEILPFNTTQYIGLNAVYEFKFGRLSNKADTNLPLLNDGSSTPSPTIPYIFEDIYGSNNRSIELSEEPNYNNLIGLGGGSGTHQVNGQSIPYYRISGKIWNNYNRISISSDMINEKTNSWELSFNFKMSKSPYTPGSGGSTSYINILTTNLSYKPFSELSKLTGDNLADALVQNFTTNNALYIRKQGAETIDGDIWPDTGAYNQFGIDRDYRPKPVIQTYNSKYFIKYPDESEGFFKGFANDEWFKLHIIFDIENNTIKLKATNLETQEDILIGYEILQWIRQFD